MEHKEEGRRSPLQGAPGISAGASCGRRMVPFLPGGHPPGPAVALWERAGPASGVIDSFILSQPSAASWDTWSTMFSEGDLWHAYVGYQSTKPWSASCWAWCWGWAAGGPTVVERLHLQGERALPGSAQLACPKSPWARSSSSLWGRAPRPSSSWPWPSPSSSRCWRC